MCCTLRPNEVIGAKVVLSQPLVIINMALDAFILFSD